MNIKKASKYPQAEIGIFGGSGFYALFDKAEEVAVKTPYGAPSDKIAIGEIAGRRVAFLPRHGKRHQFPPHKIPYLANLAAMKQLGVTRIIAPAACGSLKPNIKPGDFVICDQFIDRTKNRPDTFYPHTFELPVALDRSRRKQSLTIWPDYNVLAKGEGVYSGEKTVHIGCAEPYCPQTRELAIKSCKKLKIPAHREGTVVVVEGPRFSTKAESRWLGAAGASVINMTQYPEVVLARELEICYVNVSLITDYDAGLIGQKNVKAVDFKTVKEVFGQNIERVRELIVEMVENMPEQRTCECGRALAEASF